MQSAAVDRRDKHLLAVVLIAIFGHILLRPLRRAVERIAILSVNHLPGALPSSAIRELNALSQAVNQLIREKHRNYLRRKLKLLSWRQTIMSNETPQTRSSLVPRADLYRLRVTCCCKRLSIPWAITRLLGGIARIATPGVSGLSSADMAPGALAEPTLVLPIP